MDIFVENVYINDSVMGTDLCFLMFIPLPLALCNSVSCYYVSAPIE